MNELFIFIAGYIGSYLTKKILDWLCAKLLKKLTEQFELMFIKIMIKHLKK